jgi:hypothetical protein
VQAAYLSKNVPQLVKHEISLRLLRLRSQTSAFNGIHLLEAIESSTKWMHIVALFETFQSTPLQR